MTPTIQLFDGSNVAAAAFIAVKMNFDAIKKSEPKAIDDLIKACKDKTFKPTDSKPILVKRCFIDESGKVHDDVRKIVLHFDAITAAKNKL